MWQHQMISVYFLRRLTWLSWPTLWLISEDLVFGGGTEVEMSSQLSLGWDNTRRIVIVLIHYASINNNFTQHLKMLSVCRSFHCSSQMCSFPLQNSELLASLVVALPECLYLYLGSYWCQLSSLKCIWSGDKKIKRGRLGDEVILFNCYFFPL